MNEKAQAWLDALRSGKFAQTKYNLKDDMGYCCLGVACEVVRGEEHWMPRIATSGQPEPDGMRSFFGESYKLPDPVADDMRFDTTIEIGLTAEEKAEIQAKSPYEPIRDGSLKGWAGDNHDEKFPYRVDLTRLNDYVGLSFSDIADFIEKHQREYFY